MNADMDLQMMVVRHLQRTRHAETEAGGLSHHPLRPRARDARRHVTRGLAASYAHALPFAHRR